MPDGVTTTLIVLLAIGAGLIAVTAWRTAASRRLGAIREAVLVLGAYMVYFSLRGTTEGHIDAARENAALIVELQEDLGIFVEPVLQELVLPYGWLVAVANWVYTWGYWPVIAGVAIWLYRSHSRDYRLFRNAFLISGAIGLVCFTLFPVAPPRLADMGMKDTLLAYSGSYELFYPASLVNKYAAMPSLHFGWILLISVAFARHVPRPTIRPLVLALPPAIMLASIVLTANHFIVDAVAGGIVALSALLIAARLPSLETLLEATTRRRAWFGGRDQDASEAAPVGEATESAG